MTDQDFSAENPDEQDSADAKRGARIQDLEERASRAEEERVSQAAALEDDRQRRAVDLAVAQDRREQRVDMLLASHEERLKTINGSIARNATATETLTSIVRDIKSEQDRRDAVNAALVEATRSKGSKRLSRFQFLCLIVGALIGILTFALALVQAVYHG